jgi:hypothetical protein
MAFGIWMFMSFPAGLLLLFFGPERGDNKRGFWLLVFAIILYILFKYLPGPTPPY